MSADTIIPDPYNPQNLNRYSYVINNPLKYTDPTGHSQSCEDGDICWSPNTTSSSTSGNGNGQGGNNHNDDEDDDPDPNPTHQTSGTTGGSTHDHPESDGSEPIQPISLSNYNYYLASHNLPLYQYYSWMYDIEITGQFGLVYANNSPLTVSLDPNGLNLRNVYYQNNEGFSANFGTQPSLGYAQSLPHSVISSVTGINVNPITGGVQSNLAVGLDGPISYRQSVTVRATVRPMETVAATIAGGAALTYAFFGPAGVLVGGEAARQLIPALP